jgi:glycosyltransferase involved in cell wall biosynthesis
MPRVICLQGQAGVGKTSFIRNGISKILNRPFKHINMGGICDGDYLIGHESTYVGSKPGMIVNSLIESKVMNPIIFMDEVDEISNSEKGIDVQSVLIHLTDPVQNSDFQDKYFGGLKIDLSKVLFVFSCNDESKISPILKDRLNIIKAIADSGLNITIIGNGWETVLPPHEHIKFINAVNAEALDGFVSKSKLVLALNSSNGACERVFNAMSYGCCVLGDFSTTLETLFKDGKDIVFYEKNNFKNLKNKLNDLLNSNMAESIASRGLKKVESSHLWTNRVDELIKISS